MHGGPKSLPYSDLGRVIKIDPADADVRNKIEIRIWKRGHINKRVHDALATYDDPDDREKGSKPTQGKPVDNQNEEPENEAPDKGIAQREEYSKAHLTSISLDQ
jgi:hypothetical protein